MKEGLSSGPPAFRRVGGEEEKGGGEVGGARVRVGFEGAAMELYGRGGNGVATRASEVSVIGCVVGCL